METVSSDLKGSKLESIPSTDSTSRFKSILRKLDEVKIAQAQQKGGRTMAMSVAEVSKQLMENRPRTQPNTAAAVVPNRQIESAPEPELPNSKSAGSIAKAKERPNSANIRRSRPETVPEPFKRPLSALATKTKGSESQRLDTPRPPSNDNNDFPEKESSRVPLPMPVRRRSKPLENKSHSETGITANANSPLMGPRLPRVPKPRSQARARIPELVNTNTGTNTSTNTNTSVNTNTNPNNKTSVNTNTNTNTNGGSLNEAGAGGQGIIAYRNVQEPAERELPSSDSNVGGSSKRRERRERLMKEQMMEMEVRRVKGQSQKSTKNEASIDL